MSPDGTDGVGSIEFTEEADLNYFGERNLFDLYSAPESIGLTDIINRTHLQHCICTPNTSGRHVPTKEATKAAFTGIIIRRLEAPTAADIMAHLQAALARSPRYR